MFMPNKSSGCNVSPQPPSPAGSYPCPFPLVPAPFCIDYTINLTCHVTVMLQKKLLTFLLDICQLAKELLSSN